MSIQSRTLLVAMIVLVFCVPAPAAAQTTLRWRFQEGQKFDQVLDQDTKTTITIAGQKVETNTKLTIAAVWKIKDIDDQGVAHIIQRFTRVRMKLANAASGLGFDFDSDQDAELTGIGAKMGPALEEMAKVKFALKMTPQGGIEDLRLSDETAQAFESLPADRQMGGMFSKAGLLNLVNQNAHSFPIEPLQTGDTWTANMETEVPGLGNMKTTSNLTYAGIVEVESEKLEKINIEVTATIQDTQESDAPAQTRLRDQKASGSIFFDNIAGRLSHSKFVQSMTMEVQVVGATVEQRIDQTVSVRLYLARP